MPAYEFKHPSKEEYVEVFFHMDDEKSYIDEGGISWERVFNTANLSPTYRTFDEKRQVDKNGKPLVVKKISNEFANSQGFDNAFDYIDYSNSQVDETKTPTANIEKSLDAMSKKETKELISHNKEVTKSNEKIKEKARKETRKMLKGKNIKVSLNKGTKKTKKN